MVNSCKKTSLIIFLLFLRSFPKDSKHLVCCGQDLHLRRNAPNNFLFIKKRCSFHEPDSGWRENNFFGLRFLPEVRLVLIQIPLATSFPFSMLVPIRGLSVGKYKNRGSVSNLHFLAFENKLILRLKCCYNFTLGFYWTDYPKLLRLYNHLPSLSQTISTTLSSKIIQDDQSKQKGYFNDGALSLAYSF